LGKSPSLSPPIPSFSGPNSAFNAQGLRVIIVVVQVRAMKMYVAAVEALRKKERQDETKFTNKIGEQTSLGPSYLVCKILDSQFRV